MRDKPLSQTASEYKQTVSEYKQQLGLSPYAHELNRQGTDCADDCPACQWAQQQSSPNK